jgi:hypothetical protein
VFLKYGQVAWQFFDEKALITLDFVRDKLGVITINNYHFGGHIEESGFRCIQCKIVKQKILSNELYVSAHMIGKGFDFHVRSQTPEETRQWLFDNRNLLPFPIRLEKDVNWVHLDTEDTGEKVYFFSK